MKRIFVVNFLISLLLSCGNNERTTICQELDYNGIKDSLSKIPLDSFEKFQTFDEFTMKGLGLVEKAALVYVYYSDRFIITRYSNQMDSLNIYERQKCGWVNLRWENFQNKNVVIDKNGLGMFGEADSIELATSYNRLIQEGRVLILKRVYFNDSSEDMLIIKKPSNLTVIQIINDRKDYNSPYDEMIKMADYYQKNGNMQYYDVRRPNLIRRVVNYNRIVCDDKIEYKNLETGDVTTIRLDGQNIENMKVDRIGEFGYLFTEP
jgi:hypothetical protein